MNNYGEKIDPHIYINGQGCETKADWIGLAMAALDQGDINPRHNIWRELECMLEDAKEKDGADITIKAIGSSFTGGVINETR